MTDWVNMGLPVEHHFTDEEIASAKKLIEAMRRPLDGRVDDWWWDGHSCSFHRFSHIENDGRYYVPVCGNLNVAGASNGVSLFRVLQQGVCGNCLMHAKNANHDSRELRVVAQAQRAVRLLEKMPGGR